MQKIFLVEDDEYLGRVYMRAFHFAGFEVELAQDGEVALESLSCMDPLPEVIILDVLIPKKDGFEVLQSLRKDPRYIQVPIVMLTNSFVEHDTERFLSAGADLYLLKIAEQTKDVVQKIGELIKKGRTVATNI
jgi:DNA-binding response OmpR family regulator